jgi:hypothetical protein
MNNFSRRSRWVLSVALLTWVGWGMSRGVDARAAPAPLVSGKSNWTRGECQTLLDQVGSQSDGSPLSREWIELELSGHRWVGGDSKCLDPKRFKVIRAHKAKVNDADLLEPKYILKKGRQFKVIQERWIDDFSFEVTYVFIGTKGKTEVSVTEKMVFTLNFGQKREQLGCVSQFTEPAFLTLREDCHHE